MKTPKRIDKNLESRDLFVYDCIDRCGREVRYLKYKLAKGTYRCRSCASKLKPPPPQFKEPYRAIYNAYVLAVTKRRGLTTDISFDEFLEFTKVGGCHYCDRPILWERFTTSTAARSKATHLDRKDNSLGYSKANCVVCCWSCNMTKGNRFSYEEFMSLSPILKDIERNRRIC